MSYDPMQTWRTRVCRLYINQYSKVGIIGSPQDRREETEKGYKNREIYLEFISLSRFSEIATNIALDSALHSQSNLNRATSTREQAEQNERQEKSPKNPIKLRTNVEKEQLDRNEKQPFDSTPSGEAITEREESILTMHRSN